MTDAITPSRDIARLIEIMAALRTPGTGCPWDLEQNFETIAPYTIEEAYEVADAIARRDLPDLKDELGDLLLQVVYHARLAEEQGAFAFGDVVEAITRKMIRRHPHVFGDGAARDPASIKAAWDRIKAEERAEKAAERVQLAQSNSLLTSTGRGRRGDAVPDGTPAPNPSPQGRGEVSEGAATSPTLSDVPVGLPALTRAVKLQDKAAKVGFDWPNLAPVFDKLKEEIAEFEEVARPADPRGESLLASGDSPPRSRPPDAAPSGRLAERESEGAIKEEFGDMLFVMANIARHLKLDAEAALRAANQKFVRRFAHIEVRLAERGKTPSQSTLEEMDALWDEAKARDKKRGAREA
ncbi:nucleoside triphosphate pyrophosphohydrolase [Hyphomicrobium denitrificans]|nr:nucleoside triphosphate pyrophosphohydrolase [Hyphomicrobium denitrificans]